jgi:diguanylate cyclase (GGDEF)-like protein
VLSELERAKRELALARESIAKLTCDQGELSDTIGRLTEIALTDVLTSLANRRRFCEVLEAALELSVLQNAPLSLIMIDVDWFKSYNDTYGHSAGDQVLCAFAQQLQQSSRAADVVARYGGEEFAILLPLADATQAMECAERQRLGIESFCWPSRQITASFGVATLGPMNANSSTLVEEADRALYHAKRHGRNRVIHFGTLARDPVLPGASDDGPSNPCDPFRTALTDFPSETSTARDARDKEALDRVALSY